MNIKDFQRILTSFADRPTDFQFEKGRLLTEIRGELIEATVYGKDHTLYVNENDSEEPAIKWIVNRIACLPQLADRIVDFISTDNSFVTPSGTFLDDIEFDPEEKEKKVENSIDALMEIFDRKIPGTSNIVYLTSDAGEGKTTLIDNLALIQAKRFKEKKTDWLVLPVPLGGKPFLRFDDIVIASIVNNFRFRYLYYDSFIELVRLGCIVPAFDGFEEMFLSNSTGEALSATAGLINKMDSSGSLLIAARKAYFDYQDFGHQANMWGSIQRSVSFSKLTISRWDRDKFIEYADKRGLKNGLEVYELISAKLKSEHAILTRPVLVKQLFDVFTDMRDINDLVRKLDSAISYFPAFVEAIIIREANTKWIDNSGEPFKPILSVEQHYELLSYIAEEMWLNSTDSLNGSVVDLISEMFVDQYKIPIGLSRQVKERLKQHALIIKGGTSSDSYRFDHEEFKDYFLGICMAYKILSNKIFEIRNILNRGVMPRQSIESLTSRLKLSVADFDQIHNLLNVVIKGESQFSYVKENAGNILMQVINDTYPDECRIVNYEFPGNSLLTVKLNNLVFENCHFQSTSTHHSYFVNCKFINCQFDRIEVNDSAEFSGVFFDGCEISVLIDAEKEAGFHDRYSIEAFLRNLGILFPEEPDDEQPANVIVMEADEELLLVERAMKKFIRSNNPLNENVFKVKLGASYEYFIRRLVPDLLRHGILEEVSYTGKGSQRRFKLGITFDKLNSAITGCNGSYSKFLEHFDQ
jgi:hypothetical protein